MTTPNDVGTRLRQVLEVNPSEEDLRTLDARVARAMGQPVAARGWRLGSWRTFLRPLALAAALALATGTVAATLTLLERITTESTPGVQAAWDQAELLALRETDAGVTIALERAYADLNQVAVFFTVEGLETVESSSGEAAPIEWTAELRDPAGRPAEEWARVRGGTAGTELDLTANVHTWEGEVTPSAGTWELTFTSIGYNGGAFAPGECDDGAADPACASQAPSAMIEGTWRFVFELPQPAGTVVSTDVTASEGNAAVTLTELRISPTMIAAAMSLRVEGEAVTSWATANDTLVSIEGPNGEYTANTSYHVTGDPDDQGPGGDQNEFLTTEGSDDAAGSWEIIIPVLWYAAGEGGPETGTIVDGPITIAVDVP